MIEPKKWVKFTEALNAAGVKTGTGRGFWGGVAQDGAIVVTSWIQPKDVKDGRRRIHRPFTNHGGLRRAWDSGEIAVGTKVRVILTDPGNSETTGKKAVKAACVLPGYWRIVTFGEYEANTPHLTAWVEPVAEAANATITEADIRQTKVDRAIADIEKFRKTMPRISVEEILSARHEGHKY